MFQSLLFYVFSVVLVASALGVILARNPVHSVLLLVLCFFNSAVIWLLLGAEFLGIVLVLVYVGAVMVLFLFVVMMLDVNVEEFRKSLAGYWPLAAAVLARTFPAVPLVGPERNSYCAPSRNPAGQTAY